MPSHEEVSEKFRELKQRRLKQRRKDYLSCSPINCVSNSCHRVRGIGKVQLCLDKKVLQNKRLFVCDNEETSGKCSFYVCKHTRESIEVDFVKILESPSICGSEYPKLGILIWCLQGRDGDNTTRVSRFFGLLKRLLTFTWW